MILKLKRGLKKMAKLTLFSAYNYCKAHNENLFEAFETIPDIDADLLTNVLLTRGGEFGLIYPDINFLKMQVETSVKKWQHTIARWVKIQNEGDKEVTIPKGEAIVQAIFMKYLTTDSDLNTNKKRVGKSNSFLILL